MRKVSLADQESRMGPADVVYPLTDGLGASDVALNYYELEPGDSTAFGLHAHENQEEVFYVESGTLTFHTDGDSVDVHAGELVRFGPGEFQQSRNEGDERVTVLAIGAPQDAGATEILRECPACGETTTQELELTDEQDAVVAKCAECGTETGRYT